MKNIFLILFSLLLFSTSAMCEQPASPVPVPVPTTTGEVDRPSKTMADNDQNNFAEIQALREQNKIIRDYQSSLLDTVYWSLAGIFGTTLLLAGFSWFTNFKIYDSDRRRLIEDFQEKAQQLESSVALKLQENALDLDKATTARLEALDKKLEKQISNASDAIGKSYAALEKNLTSLTKRVDGDDAKSKNIHKDLANISAEMRLIEEVMWGIKGLHGNMLITQMQGLQSAKDAENTFLFKLVLERMRNTVNDSFLAKKIPIDQTTMKLVNDGLDLCTGIDDLQLVEIRKLLNKIEIEPENAVAKS